MEFIHNPKIRKNYNPVRIEQEKSEKVNFLLLSSDENGKILFMPKNREKSLTSPSRISTRYIFAVGVFFFSLMSTLLTFLWKVLWRSLLECDQHFYQQKHSFYVPPEEKIRC